MAVISLVIEAIGRTRSGWLEYNTLLVCRSTIMALPEAISCPVLAGVTVLLACACGAKGTVIISARLNNERRIFVGMVTFL